MEGEMGGGRDTQAQWGFQAVFLSSLPVSPGRCIRTNTLATKPHTDRGRSGVPWLSLNHCAYLTLHPCLPINGNIDHLRPHATPRSPLCTGYQSLLLVPTGILAHQHLSTLQGLVAHLPSRLQAAFGDIVLLTSGLKVVMLTGRQCSKAA